MEVTVEFPETSGQKKESAQVTAKLGATVAAGMEGNTETGAEETTGDGAEEGAGIVWNRGETTRDATDATKLGVDRTGGKDRKEGSP